MTLGFFLVLTTSLTPAGYQDRVYAAWLGQILGTLMGFQFEHKQAAVRPVIALPARYQSAPADDDYYYELVALRAFEKYGTDMTIDQLGAQWKENNAGAWGSSKETRLNLSRGIPASQAGHPRYNKLWFTIGPQFSADIYGMIAPGRPNLAAALARKYGRINGHAEGVDGAVFVAGMVSLAFVESDSRTVVRKAAQLIHPGSPYRKALDQAIQLAEKNVPFHEAAEAVNSRWQIEYPATNNAVANGAMIALSVWYGAGDYLKSINFAFQAGDFTDADCNAANAGAVAGALNGTKGIPAPLIAQLHDRLEGKEMGGVPITPPVSESIESIAKRTAALGLKLTNNLASLAEPVRTQPAELFTLADLGRLWNPDWELVHAGFGGAGGGLAGLRGNTHIEGDALATYPRDEVRALYLIRRLTPASGSHLTVEVAADAGRAWQLEVFADNDRLLSEIIETPPDANAKLWRRIEVPLAKYAGREAIIRLYQRVLLPNRIAGNAYWRSLGVTGAQ